MTRQLQTRQLAGPERVMTPVDVLVSPVGPHGVDRDDAPPEEAGFTIVETVVALAIFGLLTAVVAASFAGLFGFTKTNQNRALALNVANKVIDRLHAVPALQLPNGTLAPERYTVDGVEFQVVTSAAFVPQGADANGSACDAGAGGLSAKRISVAVTWEGMGSTKPVRSDTLRRLTVADLNPSKGSTSIKIVDRNNAVGVGHVVTLQPGNKTYKTGNDGCAVFLALEPGLYTAQLGTPGFVDRAGQPAPLRSVSVIAGALVKDPGFEYDRAAALTTSFSTAPGYPMVPQPGVSVGESVAGAKAYPACTGSVTPCSSSSATGAAIQGLFPSVSGYRAWIGSCAGARLGTPNATVLPPGGSATTVLTAGRVKVTTQKKDSSRLFGGTVTFKQNSDAGCAGGYTTSLIAAVASDVVQVSLPYGTWLVSVNGGPAISQSFTNASEQNVTVKAP